MGANLQITAIVDGALAVVFGADALWAILGLLLGNLLGGVVMALHSAQGPRLGLPQMISSRAQFGVYGAVIPLCLVILMYLGFTATGTYAGWDTGLLPVPVEIYARAPDQLTTVAHRTEGESVWTFDGRTAWQATVNSAIPFTVDAVVLAASVTVPTTAEVREDNNPEDLDFGIVSLRKRLPISRRMPPTLPTRCPETIIGRAANV